MSIKDMFAIAKSYGDPVSNGLNQFKDYLSVENALNKNWQDALTFGNNTAAINAHNALSAYTDQEKKRKAQGEVAALENWSRYIYDPILGTYNPEYEAAQNAARVTYNTRNPYAIAANHQQFRDTSNNAANQVAGHDPALAQNLRNQALGDLGIYARQNRDGTLNVTNSQGYTNTMTDPNLAAMFGADPLKTRQTLATWGRDDQSSARDYREQLGLYDAQAQHNRENNAASLNLQNDLNIQRAKEEAALKMQMAKAEYDWKKANGASSTPNVDMKIYYETRNSIFNRLLEQGQDWQTAHNNAEIAANDMFGFSKPSAEPTTTDVTSGIIANKLPQNQQSNTQGTASNSQAAATPPELGSSTFAGTRLGSYQLPPRADTRQDEINQLTAYIAQMQAKYDQNAQINPNSYYSQQQLKAINQAKAQLAQVQAETDRAYHNRVNPINSAWNWVFYGDSMPQQGVK